MDAPPADPYGLVGRALDGRYAVEAVVAHGGFGVVYRGRHPTLDREVALKVARDGGGDAAARRLFAGSFLAEAKALAALDHPAVVRVLDYGACRVGGRDDTPWMALEWVEGRTLAADLDARRGRGGRSPEACMALLRPVLEALAAAHDAGLAHRDVKPANVMLPARVARGAPASRVLDFGVARPMEPDASAASGHTRTRASFVALSLPYAAPEQVSATRTGPWTDVHALGLVLTEALVDMAPYQGRDAVALTAAVMSPARPTPARFGVDVGAWEPVLARALALRPDARYADAGQLLRALDEALPRARHEGTARAPEGHDVAPPPRRVTRAFLAWTAASFVLASAPLQYALVLAPLRARAAATPSAARVTQPATPPAPAPPDAAVAREAAPPDAAVALAVDAAAAPLAPSAPRQAPRRARPRGSFHGLPTDEL